MWIVPDYNIPEFVKTLKTLVKIGPHVQIEPYDVEGLKLQTSNIARSVCMQMVFTPDFFDTSASYNSSQNSVYCDDVKISLPLKYLIKVSAMNISKFVDQIEIDFSDTHFSYKFLGTKHWTKHYEFEVYDPDNLAPIHDLDVREPFMVCPLSVIDGELSTFPRGILEATMYMDDGKLHLKSYDENTIRSSVKSQVAITSEELEILQPMSDHLTFSLKELRAAVKLWEDLIADAEINVYEEGQGCPLVFKVQSENYISSIVTATLSSDISKTINITRVHNDESFLDSTRSEVVAESDQRRHPRTQDDILNASRLTQTRDQYDLTNFNMRPIQESEFQPPSRQKRFTENSEGANLLFGDGSDSDESMTDGSLFGIQQNVGGRLMDSAVDETASTQHSFASRLTVLAEDSD